MALEDYFLWKNTKVFSPIRVLLAKYTPQGEFDSFVPNEKITEDDYSGYLYRLVLIDNEGNEHRTTLMPREKVGSTLGRIIMDLTGKHYSLNIEIHKSLLRENKPDSEPSS